jgi:serine/threonine-protein kinase
MPGAMDGEDASDALVRPGDALGEGRFSIDSPLGRGGMGAVFRATDRTTGRAIAMKVLHPHLAREERHMARFRREADVLSRLDHPHIVRALVTGEEPDGLSWIAMELLEGRSLAELLGRSGTFTPTRAIAVARQILAALAAAHAIGVLHRDLKPGNVVVTERATGGDVVKVVDFGLARLATTKTYEKLTATGQVVGTPAFMAPEQALGDRADERTDLYAVGAILCAMLTGAPPYGRGKLVDVLPRILTGRREKLTVTHPELGPLAGVIEKALEDDRAERYATAADMDAALAALTGAEAAAGATIAWRPPVPLETLRLLPAPELEGTRVAARPAPRPRASPATTSTAPPSSSGGPAVAAAHAHDAEKRARAPATSVRVVGAWLLGGVAVLVLAVVAVRALLASEDGSASQLAASDLGSVPSAAPAAIAVVPVGVALDASIAPTADPAQVADRSEEHREARRMHPVPTQFTVWRSGESSLTDRSGTCAYLHFQDARSDSQPAFLSCWNTLGSSSDTAPYVFEVGVDDARGRFRVQRWITVHDPRVRRCLRIFADGVAPPGCIIHADEIAWQVTIAPDE